MWPKFSRRIDAIKQQILSSLGMKTPPVGIGQNLYTPEQRDRMRQEFAKANNPGDQPFAQSHDKPCETLVEKTQSFIPQCDPPRKFSNEAWTRDGAFNIYFKVAPSPQQRSKVRREVVQATLHLFKISLDPEEQLKAIANDQIRTNWTQEFHNFRQLMKVNALKVKESHQLKVSIHQYVFRSKKGTRGSKKSRPLVSRIVSLEDSGWLAFPIEPKVVTRWMEQKKNRNFGLTVTVQAWNINNHHTQPTYMLNPNVIFSHKDCSSKQPVKETALPGLLERVAVTDSQNHVRVARRTYPTLDVKYFEVPLNPDTITDSAPFRVGLTATAAAAAAATGAAAEDEALFNNADAWETTTTNTVAAVAALEAGSSSSDGSHRHQHQQDQGVNNSRDMDDTDDDLGDYGEGTVAAASGGGGGGPTTDQPPRVVVDAARHTGPRRISKAWTSSEEGKSDSQTTQITSDEFNNHQNHQQHQKKLLEESRESNNKAASNDCLLDTNNLPSSQQYPNYYQQHQSPEQQHQEQEPLHHKVRHQRSRKRTGKLPKSDANSDELAQFASTYSDETSVKNDFLTDTSNPVFV
ncbi:unnamed protein product [Notodromas monacha]|uniref:TGF-beta propeptide domain-containing protein n=1 Tax=Notodromas monacha TaxID=399045 RepID=A0A7R9BYV6_9CRUS|nr:unnamed protein product [Notodromas monacha]CAG0923207.1 unnamed protein product [Notodromas monacha]